MKRSLLSRTGLGPLHCDRRTRAPETTMTLNPGDFCAWPSGGATLHGKIAAIHTAGSVADTGGRTLSATPLAPIARIEVYRADGNGWVPTGTFVASAVELLISSAVLHAPVDLRPELSVRQKTRLGSTMQSRTFQGMDLTIDRPKGTKISGVGPDGQPYHTEYQCDYGFFPEVKSHDGEELDVYCGPSESSSQKVYLVTQYKARADDTKAPVYDETKCVLGCSTGLEAKLLYGAHVHPTMYGGLASLPLDSFKTQIAAAKGQTSPIRFEGLTVEDDMPPNPADSDGSPLGASSSHPNPPDFGGQPSGNHDGTPGSGGSEAIPPTTPSAKLAKQKAAEDAKKELCAKCKCAIHADKAICPECKVMCGVQTKATDTCAHCGCAAHTAKAACPTCKVACGEKAAKPTKEKRHAPAPRNPAPAGAPGASPQAGAERGQPGPRGEPTEPDDLHVRQARVRAVRAEAREVDIIASTEAVDSYGEVVRANWDLKRFLANPVILWAHNRWADRPPVGRAKNVIVAEGQLLMTVVFSDLSPFDEEIFQKYVQGFLRGFSVGFNPRRVITEEIDGEERIILDDNELHEVSCVTIPSNPEALVVGYAKQLGLPRTRIAEMLYRRGYEKAPVPYHPYAVETATAWDGEAEINRWRKVCSSDGSGDTGTITWGKFKQMFAWYDKANPETFGAYKLPHHIVRDGRLMTSKAGVQAAGNAIQGSRGGVAIPDADMPGVKDHLARHYAQFDAKPPWDEGKSAQVAATKEQDDMDLKEMQSALTEKTTEAANHKAALETERQKSADLDGRVKTLGSEIESERTKATAAVEAEKVKAAQLLDIEKSKTLAAEERATTFQAKHSEAVKRAEAAETKLVELELSELVKTKMTPAEQPLALRIFKGAQAANLLGTENDPWANFLESVKLRAPHGLTDQVIKGAGVATVLENPLGSAAPAGGPTHPGALGHGAERMGTSGGDALLELAVETSTAA